MSKLIKVDKFIADHVTERTQSLFGLDLEAFHDLLWTKTNNKSALVIGGAGTIGSSFIKALLKFNISKLYVVDINENGLTELVRDIRSSKNLVAPNEIKTYPLSFSDPVFEEDVFDCGPF